MDEAYLAKRAKVFEDFLKARNLYIDFNGIHYTLVDNQANVITVTSTPDEMYSYMIGYNKSLQDTKSHVAEIENLNEVITNQNEENIKNYESIIKILGEEANGLKKDLKDATEQIMKNVEAKIDAEELESLK